GREPRPGGDRRVLGRPTGASGNRQAGHNAGDAVVSAEPLLETRGLMAGYGASKVVRDLHLEVRRSEVVALLGPNGAGKSTTLLTMAGELPSLGGQVLLHGEATNGPLHKRVRAGLGLISEERTVLMQLTVEENLRVN